MAIILDQRSQLFQTLGNIATSAANAATEGIAEAAKTDPKTVDTALKLFGGFDRSEFENINRQAPNLLLPAVRPPASYEGPVEYFKPLSNVADQGFLVRSKDLLQQLEDPRFRMADGLSGFSDNRITQTLAQTGMIINTKPGEDVSLGGLGNNGIIVVDGGKPAGPADLVASLDSFGKLYMMENTVAKQLQLHEQLDLGTFGNFSGAKQNPRMDRGLKGMPDAQAAEPQPKRILDLQLDHALNGTPETVGEFLQMIDVLQAEVNEILQKASSPFGSPVLRDQAFIILKLLGNLERLYQDADPNLPPSNQSLEYFGLIRQRMKQVLPIG
jgi:hypothetical protein